MRVVQLRSPVGEHDFGQRPILIFLTQTFRRPCADRFEKALGGCLYQGQIACCCHWVTVVAPVFLKDTKRQSQKLSSSGIRGPDGPLVSPPECAEPWMLCVV